MLDVHPPHNPTHTWKDFFIHIATIVVGLLIAVGLEQTVEAIHRHQESETLRAGLERESRQILFDTNRVETGETYELQWCRQVEAQDSDAVRDHRALEQLAPHTAYGWDVPDNPVYTSAKASAKLGLLTDEETAGYGELDSLLFRVGNAYGNLIDARRALDSFFNDLGFGLAAGVKPLANASPTELRQLHSLVSRLESAHREMRYWSRQSRGAVLALLAGERDLRKIESAERQFDQVP